MGFEPESEAQQGKQVFTVSEINHRIKWHIEGNGRYSPYGFVAKSPNGM
jgi:hypothetical protein